VNARIHAAHFCLSPARDRRSREQSLIALHFAGVTHHLRAIMPARPRLGDNESPETREQLHQYVMLRSMGYTSHSSQLPWLVSRHRANLFALSNRASTRFCSPIHFSKGHRRVLLVWIRS